MKNSSSNKSHGTPIKMLMAKEMCKEAQSKRKSLSVVAQLMGIDEMNLDQRYVPNITKRKWHEDYQSTTLEVELRGCRQQEAINFNKLLLSELQQHCYDKMEFRDAYESLQRPTRASIIKDQWGNCNENQNANSRKAIVHEKLMEEKHPVEEERQNSEELHDDLEVLSSKKDFVLKLLQDPDSIISKNMRNACASPQLQKRHIAVLKPSQKNEKKTENVVRKEQYPVVNKSEWGTTKQNCNRHHSISDFTRPKAANFPQPTRIVILKPSTRIPKDVMAKVAPPIPLCKLLGQSGFFGDLGDTEGLESTSVEKQISQQRLETARCQSRDESLHSSVSANRCSEESSSNKSETDNIEEDGGSFSDSEIVTPNSRHSWEYAKRRCSPQSALSFSQASYSPNSSVVMEAKKQLLDRWASALSNENSQEQIPTTRFSFSLGEMLAITNIKEGESGSKFSASSSISCDREVELELSTSCKNFGKINDMKSESLLGNLSRSKSLPISPSAYEHIGAGVESSIFWPHASTGSKEVAKAKNDKSSFKEKISSFLFSKIRKTNREKLVSPVVQFDGKADSDSAGLDVNKIVASKDALGNSFPEGGPEVNYGDITSNATIPASASAITKNASHFVERSKTCNRLRDEIKFRNYENLKGNQDQPSPTSVLDAPFDDETNDTVSQSSEANAGPHALSRASPIESVARSLSWENTHLDMPSPDLSVLNKISSKVHCNEEHFALIRRLHSSSALEKSSMISAGYHSLGSHLDEILHSEFFDWKKEEAKFKERKPKHNLLFDNTISAIVESDSTSPTVLQSEFPWTREFGTTPPDAFDTSAVSAEVWRLVKDSIFGETKWAASDCCDSSLTVDRAPMKGGYGLCKYSVEVQEITEDISGEMLKDLIGEAINA